VLDVKSMLRFLFGFYCFGRIYTCDVTIASIGVVRSLPHKLFLNRRNCIVVW